MAAAAAAAAAQLRVDNVSFGARRRDRGIGNDDEGVDGGRGRGIDNAAGGGG